MADGGLGAVARALVGACVNEVMSAQADAMCEETGTSRNGFRERRLETQVGAIALRIPKLREGTCFPEGIVERWSRVDRAVICAASEMSAPGVSCVSSSRFEQNGTPDVFPDYSGYAAPASSSRACRIVLHPSAFLSFPPRYHSM